MYVFVTGASGWVGSAVVDELLLAGHQVIGQARDADRATQLAAKGAHVLRTTLDDVDTLSTVAAKADAVIHTAFNHDFSRYIDCCEQDRCVIDALGSALKGSDRPLLVTSGLLGLPCGATEADFPSATSPRKSETTARDWAQRGVRAATIRLAPSVHGKGDHGLVPMLAQVARRSRVSAFMGGGQNCWAGVHRLDAARVYRLALEQGVTESVYHAVADEAVPFMAIADVIGKSINVPVERRHREHFGSLASFAGADMSASSARTRQVLNWTPERPGLLDDLDIHAYYTD